MLLGEKCGNTIITKVGCISNARWMSKILCVLKATLLLNYFPLEAEELEAILRLVESVINIYVHHWFNANNAADAPWNQLKLFYDICDWRKVCK